MSITIKKYTPTIVRWVGLIAVTLIFGIWSEWNLLSEYNINGMIETATPLIIACIGLTFIFAHGGMDISSGAVIALSALLAVLTMNATGSIILGILVAMLVSVICYIINAVVTNQFGLMSTITSLSIMFIARGIVTYVCQLTPNESISIANVDVTLFKKNHIFMIVVTFVVVLILTVVFNYTKIGKASKAISDNVVSAQQNGVKVNLIKILDYTIAGFCVGLASIFKMSYTGVVQSTTGNGFEMDVLVVLILGGMSLSGGADTKVSSAVIGSITYVLLIKGLTIIGLDPSYVVLIKAIIFICVIFITAKKSNLNIMPR